MSYSPVAGDYGVVSSNGFFAKLIRLGTVSRWNHAFIYIGDGQVVEANPTGVAISPVSKYPKIAWNMHEGLSEEQRAKIVAYAKSTVGRPYNFGIIIMLAFRAIGVKIFPRSIINYLAKHDGYICSELVAECYAEADFPICQQPDLCNPGDLAERLIWQ
jgi:Permuted papain-like amidase enzyme, YaeF/YiiX, C92 family